MEKDIEPIIEIDKKTIDVLITNVIPTTKYFETRFNGMDSRMGHVEKDVERLREDMNKGFEKSDKALSEFKSDIDRRFQNNDIVLKEFKTEVSRRFENNEQALKEFKSDVHERFEQVDKRFEQVDKRFEQVDKRFEQVDKRFEQVDQRLQQIILSIDGLGNKIDNKVDKQRDFTVRMFSISIMISFLGVFGVLLKLFNIL
jgi:chromosome segregation ATPase